MSADNGIYILESKDGFRVVYAHAIDNIYEHGWKFNSKYLKKYFGEAPVLTTRDEAWKEAKKLYYKVIARGILEYGINIIPGHEDTQFPE